MTLTNKQRQRIGSLLAQERNLKNDLNKVENKIVEELLQIIGRPFTEELTYDLPKIKTERAEGRNGFYEKATTQDNQNSEDYHFLIEDLKQHDGKLTKDGLFIWLFSDEKTIGMKTSRK